MRGYHLIQLRGVSAPAHMRVSAEVEFARLLDEELGGPEATRSICARALERTEEGRMCAQRLAEAHQRAQASVGRLYPFARDAKFAVSFNQAWDLEELSAATPPIVHG